MDLNTVTEIVRARQRGSLPAWRAGDAWLAGGTWLFSEPQPAVQRLVDLETLGWPSLEVTEHGLTIAATCRIVELERFAAPADWAAAPLIGECCRALLMSFKIWNAATVGGNICMSLPAGAMTSLATALAGVCVLWSPDGAERRVPVDHFVTGVHENVLRPGELLRAIEISIAALRSRAAFRQISLSSIGRSAALLIGTAGPAPDAFALTVTASTVRPLRLTFSEAPSAGDLRSRLDREIPDSLYYDDVNGEPDYRKHMTYLFAEQIRAELAGGAP